MNMPLGVIKEAFLLQDDDCPIAIDLDKQVVIKLNRVTYQILSQYGQVEFKTILTELRECYSWSEIQAAIVRLMELAEFGLIFTDGNHPIPEQTGSIHFVVSPGFIRNRFARSIVSNVAYCALLKNLAQHINLSMFVADDEIVSDFNETFGDCAQLGYVPVPSYAAITELPLECNAILMFTPLHPEDLQFLTNRQCPILLFISDYGDTRTFSSLSLAYSSLKENDIWVYPQFWAENLLHSDFLHLQHGYPLPLGVEPSIVEQLPTRTALKSSLSQMFGHDNFHSTSVIGVFGADSDLLVETLAADDPCRVYVHLAGSEKTNARYYTLDIGDVQEIDVLPHMLKGLDLLIFVAHGTTEAYLLYLASAVGTPVIIVGCGYLPNDPFFAHVRHCPTFDSQEILKCIANTLEVPKNRQSENEMDPLRLVSWDKTSDQLLTLYRQVNSLVQQPAVRAPRPPSHVFRKYYDPAQKRLQALALSLEGLNNVPLEIGFESEMRQNHTPSEVGIILSHLGKKRH